MKTFTSTSSTPGAPGHADRSGQQVEVVRELTTEEVEAEVGQMFEVKFSDGTVAHVFADELCSCHVNGAGSGHFSGCVHL